LSTPPLPVGIAAAQRDGIDEFILWNPSVVYTKDALDPNAEAER